MTWRVPLGSALLVVLAIPTAGFGWFHGPFSRASYRAAPPATVYYCPVPVVVSVPAAAPVPYVPAPVAAAPAPRPLYAEPRPAPPSGTAEPPKAPDAMPKAGVSGRESRKVADRFFDSYFVAGAARTPAADRCAVTFWNLSGRGLTLTIDGQDRTLPAGQSVRLDLKRDFAWGVTGRDSERQQVPAQESGVDIVIRR
jgi:hypothetical protein